MHLVLSYQTLTVAKFNSLINRTQYFTIYSKTWNLYIKKKINYLNNSLVFTKFFNGPEERTWLLTRSSRGNWIGQFEENS